MLKDFADLAPKAALAAVLIWGGSHYLVIAPEVAVRVARADHVPQCEITIQTAVQGDAERAVANLPRPGTSPSQDMAATQLRQFNAGPFGQLMRESGMDELFNIGGMTDIALAEYEQGKRAAADAYNRAVDRIKAETATSLGQAGSLCGCIADAAIAETRNEWTLFTATLGLVQPAPIKSFNERMSQALLAAGCGKAGA